MKGPRIVNPFGRGLVFLVVAVAGATARAASPLVLTLNDTNEPPYTTPAGDGFLDVIAGEAFRRAGLQLRLVKLPPERGLINASAGIEDGDLTRIAGLEKAYPNLVRVPEKLIDWHFVAFTRKARLGQASWAALAPLAVGHIKGWKIYEQNLLPATVVTTADDAVQLFTMLNRQRIDVALYERWLGQALAQQMHVDDIHVVEPSLAVREMFIYLHQRHADKVAALAAALRAVKAEGLYAKVCSEKLASLMASPAQCEAR